MPVANLTLPPELASLASDRTDELRSLIATGMSTRKKFITAEQVSLRLIPARVEGRIEPAELEIYAHAFLLRLPAADVRSRNIAQQVSALLDGVRCGCWINLCIVGYAPSAPPDPPPQPRYDG